MPRHDTSLNVHQAAAFLGCHAQTVRRLARKKKVPGFKVGQSWRFRREVLEDWMQAQWRELPSPTVLIVDDDHEMRNTLTRLLAACGYETAAAADGEAALARMQASVPDVVLLDLAMPRMSGPQTLAAIRERHGDIPAVILSGFLDGKLIGDALEYGPMLVLAKPPGKEELGDALRTSLAAGRESSQVG